MIDFEAELAKLLAQETKPLPHSELMELTSMGQQVLTSLNKKQADISTQIEEIYDLAKESDNTVLLETLQQEKVRAGLTVRTAIGLCDLIDDFYEFSLQNGSEELRHQALLMRKKADALLEECGMARIGEISQPLDPKIHTVQSAIDSNIPLEHIAKVLQSGYRYLGTIQRKATVIISKGEQHQKYSAENSQFGTKAPQW